MIVCVVPMYNVSITGAVARKSILAPFFFEKCQQISILKSDWLRTRHSHANYDVINCEYFGCALSGKF